MTSENKSTASRILVAATELFLAEGYGNTSLDQVAATAGVTKPTVYSHFGSKHGLLQAITKAHASERAAILSSALQSTGDTRSDLLGFAVLLVQRVFGHEANLWHRLAMAESIEHPEIAASIFAAGPARVIEALTNYIRAEVQAGRLICDDPKLAAEQLMGSLVGLAPIQMLAGRPLPSPSVQQRRCAQAVDTFLSAFGREPS